MNRGGATRLAGVLMAALGCVVGCGSDGPTSADVASDTDIATDTAAAAADVASDVATMPAEDVGAAETLDDAQSTAWLDDALGTTNPGLDPLLLDCIGILSCLATCPESDLVCQKSCKAQAQPGPAEHAIDLRVCFNDTCAGEGLPCWTESCWDAYAGCFGRGESHTCAEMWGCVGSCSPGDSGCQPACIGDAEDAATALVFAELLTCLDTECPGGSVSDDGSTCSTTATCGTGPCASVWGECLEPLDCE